MNLYPLLSGLYGQARGYRRRSIQRAVRSAARQSPEHLAAGRAALFRERVRDAIARFPAYAAKVRAHGGDLPDADGPLDPAALPVWTREDQNRLFEALAAPPVPGSIVHATGGSTGAPTRFYITRDSYEWRAAVSNYGYSLAGAEEGRRSLYVWGTPVKDPGPAARWKSELHHWLQRRTYFDSFLFDDRRKALCCAAIHRVKPLALVGYTGNLVELAGFVRDHPGCLTGRARTLVTAAEGLYPGQRELLQEFLAEEVFQSYGSREFMLIGMECRCHDGYHLVGTNLMTEVVDEDGRPLPPGEVGRIVITDLRNGANPFVRYEIGDLGVMADPERPCACGLPFPRLQRVEGRIQEVIVRPDGQRMTALFIPHLMKEFRWVDRYQIIHDRPGTIVVSLVSGAPLNDTLTKPIADALRKNLGGDMQISFERIDAVRRSRSGKTPIVISEPDR